MEGFINITATPDGNTGCELNARCDLKKVSKMDKAQLLHLFMRSLEMDKAEVFTHLMLLPILEAADKDDNADAEREAASKGPDPAEDHARPVENTCQRSDTGTVSPDIARVRGIVRELNELFQ